MPAHKQQVSLIWVNNKNQMSEQVSSHFPPNDQQNLKPTNVFFLLPDVIDSHLFSKYNKESSQTTNLMGHLK